MTIQELYAHYGTWAEMAYQLRLGSNTYQYWRKKGFIPYATQCMIEKKTDGLFKASFEHTNKELINDKC